MTRDRLLVAEERIRFARTYLRQFIDDLNEADWFWTPPEFTTHIAWQVAHIAASQYGLCLFRVRGRTEADESLIPQTFWDGFKVGSKPVDGAENNPPLATILGVLDNVYAQVLAELAAKTDDEVDVPLNQPHPAFSTVMGAIEYSPMHEMIHVGQITLLRRLMGKPPKR
jgi:hypothetical protein